MRDTSGDGCCQLFRDEFQRSKFSPSHDDPAVFCRSQWQRGERCFIWVLYRWLLTVFFAYGVIGSLTADFVGGKWFIYLTDWGFTLCLFVSSFGAVIATIYYIRPSYFETGSLTLKIYWVAHHSASALALMISLVFWSVLWPLWEGPAGIYNIWAHAFNSAGMILDCLLVAFPTRLMHFIYPVLFGTTYGLFSLIYFFAGGTDVFGNRYIYPILDWEKPGLTIGCFIGCMVVDVIFCVLIYWIYRLRQWVHSSCMKQQSTEVLQTRQQDNAATV